MAGLRCAGRLTFFPMLYRALAIFITVFWLTMIGLLIRKEAWPGDLALREVPVGHVVKLLLMHEQPSELKIYNGKMCLGSLRVHPHMHKGERTRVIEFSGDLHVLLPGPDRVRVQWDGELELEKTLATRRFDLGFSLRDPTQRHTAATPRFQITVSPAENLLTWAVRNGDQLPAQLRTYTLDDAGLQRALRELDDPLLVPFFQSQTRSLTPPTVRAMQSTMLIHGERIDTYLVTIEQSGQTLLEFDVSQLGQILRAQTLIGYSLAPNDLAP